MNCKRLFKIKPNLETSEEEAAFKRLQPDRNYALKLHLKNKTRSPEGGGELLQLQGRDGEAAKQSLGGDVNHEEHKVNNTGLSWGHLKHLRVSEEISEKSLHTRAHNIGHKHEDLEIGVQLRE